MGHSLASLALKLCATEIKDGKVSTKSESLLYNSGALLSQFLSLILMSFDTMVAPPRAVTLSLNRWLWVTV